MASKSRGVPSALMKRVLAKSAEEEEEEEEEVMTIAVAAEAVETVMIAVAGVVVEAAVVTAALALEIAGVAAEAAAVETGGIPGGTRIAECGCGIKRRLRYPCYQSHQCFRGVAAGLDDAIILVISGRLVSWISGGGATPKTWTGVPTSTVL
jgi:hypothetical protein